MHQLPPWNREKSRRIPAFALSYVLEPPSINPGGAGPEAMAQEAARYYQAMSNAQWVVRDVLAGENDTVTMRWTGQGTHDGNLAGIPPTGKVVPTMG
jgi:hypothetical protein